MHPPLTLVVVACSAFKATDVEDTEVTERSSFAVVIFARTLLLRDGEGVVATTPARGKWYSC